jgi:hypothetical protein
LLRCSSDGSASRFYREGPGFSGKPSGQRDHKSSPIGLLFVFLAIFTFMASVYILFSEKLNKFYVGACIDLERRFYEHNIGHSKFTSTECLGS